MKFIKDCFKGVCIGAGAILPGISSGVLCVIFGIYDKLVNSVLNIFRDFKKNFLFLLPIVLGGFIGIVLLGNVLDILFKDYPMPTKYAFIGLILGSIPLLIKQVNSKKTFRIRYTLYTLASFAIGVIMVILEKYVSSNLVGTNPDLINTLSNNTLPTLSSSILLIISGFFMSVGIVVPGVSSTIILMCFGIYDIYLSAVSTINLFILVPLGIGVIIGGFIFLKIIKYLLDNFYMQTFYSIIGFTLGSVLVLYSPITFNLTGLASILIFIVCFYIASFFEKKSN